MEDLYCAPYTILGIALLDGVIPSLVVGVCSLVFLLTRLRHQPRPYTAIVFLGAFFLFCVSATSFRTMMTTSFLLVGLSCMVVVEVAIYHLRTHIMTAACSLLLAAAYWQLTLSLVIAGGMRPAVL